MGALELQALLREIKNVRSPIQRMKLISLAWRSVQRLSPAELKELGSKLGVRGFDSVLAKLGRGPSGISPAEILRVLNSADELDDSKLPALVDGLNDPAQREELLRRGVEVLEEPDDDEEVDPHVLRPRTVEGTVMAKVFGPVAEVPPPPVTELIEEQQDEPAVVEPEPIAIAVPAETEDRPAVETVVVEVDEVEPPVVIEAPTPPPPVVTEPEPVADRPPIETDVAAPVAAAAGTIARFRSLRKTLDDAEQLDIEDIRSLLESFPDGWSRRRALVSILRRGDPEDLDDALSLIEDLERPTDRRWCVAALIDTRDLSDADADRVLERFPFPSLARRLRRRSAKLPA